MALAALYTTPHPVGTAEALTAEAKAVKEAEAEGPAKAVIMQLGMT